MDWAALSAAAAWQVHAQDAPPDAIRRMPKAAYLLHLKGKQAHRFLPMRLVFAWIDGVPFTQRGGRGVGIRDQYAALAELGLARVSENSPFFDRFWDRYHGRCVEMGNAPACHIGDDPRTGRVFWTTPS